MRAAILSVAAAAAALATGLTTPHSRLALGGRAARLRSGCGEHSGDRILLLLLPLDDRESAERDEPEDEDDAPDGCEAQAAIRVTSSPATQARRCAPAASRHAASHALPARVAPARRIAEGGRDAEDRVAGEPLGGGTAGDGDAREHLLLRMHLLDDTLPLGRREPVQHARRLELGGELSQVDRRLHGRRSGAHSDVEALRRCEQRDPYVHRAVVVR